MELDEYQRAAHQTAKSRDIEVFTLGLFGEAGSVASAIKKLKRDNDAEEVVRAEISIELGDVMWYLAEIATYYGLSLSEIAAANLDKTKYLFGGDELSFEEAAPPEQRFPRQGQYEFIDLGEKVAIRFEGQDFGDPLDDNAHYPDGYKFHDVFHFAYMTRLGWSPVTRGLLGLKRKYDPDIDRVEDGARSRFLEEGVLAITFSDRKPWISWTGGGLFAAAPKLSTDCAEIVEDVLARIRDLSDRELKTKVYLTGPMKQSLREERLGLTQLNRPLF